MENAISEILYSDPIRLYIKEIVHHDKVCAFSVISEYPSQVTDKESRYLLKVHYPFSVTVKSLQVLYTYSRSPV